MIKLFPACDVYRNLHYEYDGRDYEIDTLVYHDHKVFLVESKSGLLTESAKRGGDKRLAADLSTNETLRQLQPAFMRLLSDEEIVIYAWADAGRRPDHAESAGACAMAGILNGFCEHEVTVRFRSYLLFVQWLERERRLFVTAPAEYICSGSYYIETGE